MCTARSQYLSKRNDLDTLLGVHCDSMVGHLDQGRRVLFHYMCPARPCFDEVLLKSMGLVLDWVQQQWLSNKSHAPRYVVLGSQLPGIFNLGGDLEYFLSCAQRQDKGGLLTYARQCVEVQHKRIALCTQFPDITTVAIVRGDALGGGFEAALSNTIIVAERGTRFGFPEAMFNLFPGMGAYSLLVRKLGQVRAEQLFFDTKLQPVEYFYELGLVHQLVESDISDDDILTSLIATEHGRTVLCANEKQGDVLNAIRLAILPTDEELMHIVNIWVNAALQISTKDQRLMQRLIKAQKRRLDKAT